MNINIMHFSDLHYSDSTKLQDLEKIKDALCEPDIDYIFFTGDLIDSNEFIKLNPMKKDAILKWLEDITKTNKLIMINGNHDLMSKKFNGWQKDFYKPFWDELSSINNLYYSQDNFKYNDGVVSVYGINLPFEYYENDNHREDENLLINCLKEGTKGASRECKKPIILLLHSPLYITGDKALNYISNFDLILSGHMHNGVMPPILDKLFPGNRGLISPTSQLFPDNARGLKTVEIDDGITTNVFISGGITKISDNSRIHFLNQFFPMEIDRLTYNTGTGNVKVKKLLLK